MAGIRPEQNPPRGAVAAAAVCARYAPPAEVPLYDGDARDDHGVRRWDALFAQFKNAQSILARSGARRVLTAGGDCAVDVAVIDYLHGLHPDLRVIWIDAHLDGNTPETSPSGASMACRSAPSSDARLRRCVLSLNNTIDPARFHYFGVHIGDDGDWALKRELDLKLLDALIPSTDRCTSTSTSTCSIRANFLCRLSRRQGRDRRCRRAGRPDRARS